MSEVIPLVITFDTRPVSDADAVLARLAKTSQTTGAAIEAMAVKTKAAFANVSSSLAAAVGVGGSGGGGGGGGGDSSPASKQMDALAKQADTLRAKLDPLAAAHLKMSDAVIQYSRMSAAGLISQTEMTAGIRLAESAFAKASDGVRKHSDSLSLNRSQMLELQHVGKALFDELAAGGSILRGLTMEGGRLFDIFGPSLGLNMERLKSGFSALTGPIGLATGGMVALGVAAASAFASFENGQDDLARSLDGVGRRSGATVAQLNAVATSGARAAGLSTGEGISLAAGFAGAGLSAGTTGSLISSSRAYGRVTGVGTDEAGASLAAALRDPVRGMGELDKQLGFVDDALAQTVKNLEASGHLQEAQALLAGRLNDALAHTTDTTWGLTKAFDDAKNFLANGFHNIGGAIAGALGYDSPTDKVAHLQSEIDDLRRSGSTDPLNAALITQLETQIEPLRKVISETVEAAAAAKREADATANSRLAGDAVRSILPDLLRQQSVANQIELLRGALSDPLVLSKMTAGGLGQSQVGQAFGNAVVMQANQSPALRQRQDYQLALQANDAFSTGETGIVAARKAELAILREYGDVARAATTAQMTLNEAIAKRNSDSKDELELARQAGRSIGLRGFDASQQAIRDRYEGYGGVLSKDAVGNNDVRKDPGIGGDLAAASHRVSLALDDLPPRVESAGGKLVTALDVVANKIGAIVIPAGAGDPRTGGATLGAFDYAHASGPGMATPGMIADAAARTGVPANIIAAIGQIENSGRLTGGTSMLGSNGRPSSAWGFGQLTNGAAADVRGVVPGFNKYNPDTAVFGSAEYLSILAGRNGGDMTRALNAYGGTDDYANKVMRTAGSAPLTIGVSGGSAAGVAPIQNQAVGNDQATENQLLANDAREKNLGPLQDAMIALGQQNDMLKVEHAALRLQADDYATSAGKIAAMTEEQKLLGEYTASQLQQFPVLRESIKNVADQYGEAAEAAATFRKQQHDLTAALDGIRSGFGDGLHTLIDDLIKGKSAGTAFRDVLEGIGQKLLSLGESMLTNSLLGGQGTSGGGLLGGLLGSVLHLGGAGGSGLLNILPKFAAGTDDAPGGPSLVGEKGPEIVNLPRGAQVIPNNRIGGAAPHVSVGGHTININGNADSVTVAQMRRELASSNAELVQQITRNLHTVTGTNQQYS